MKKEYQAGFWSKKIIFIIISILIVFWLATLFFDKKNFTEIQPQDSVQDIAEQVTSFEECKKAGFPIMESYPEKCSDGTNLFIREIKDLKETPQPRAIPQNCTIYYDGCNICKVQDSGVTVCDARYCEESEYTESKCLDSNKNN